MPTDFILPARDGYPLGATLWPQAAQWLSSQAG